MIRFGKNQQLTIFLSYPTLGGESRAVPHACQYLDFSWLSLVSFVLAPCYTCIYN